MAAQVGEIELGVKLTGDDISKAISQISENIAKKFDKAFASLSGKFDDTSNDLKNAFSQASESIKSKVTKTSESVSQSVNKDLEDVQQQAKKSGSAINGAFRSATENINKKFTGVKQNIQSQVKGAGENIKSSLSKLGSAVVAAFSVATIKNFGQACIESAAGVSAANSQFAQTFGTMQEQASNAMQAVAKESGIVESRLQGVGTSIYAFAKTTGMDSANALSMMQDALQVTADSAAYYDRSLEDTAESLKSFLKGNFENDAALGLSCTETTRNAAANKLYGKSFIELSESQKQLTLLQMVKDANQLSGAMGQASREADGWENVTGNLKEAWNQFLAVVGQPILQVATQVVKQLSSALQTLTGYAKQATDALSKFFGWDTNNQTATAIGSASTEAKSLAKSADKSTDSLKKTEKTAKKLQNSLAGFDELNVLSIDNTDDSNDNDSEETPVQADSVKKANSALKSTEKSLDNITSKLKKISSELGFDKLAEGVKKGFDSVNWGAIKGNVDSIFTDLQPIAQASFNGVKKIVRSSMGTVGKVVGGAVSVAGKSLQTVTGGVAKWLDKDKTKIAAGITTISNNISSGIDSVGTFADSIFTTMGESVDRMRPTMETSIATLLSGFTTLGLSIGEVLSGAFAIIGENLATWSTENSELLGTFFDGVQQNLASLMSTVGYFSEQMGSSLSSWWEDCGAEAFDSFVSTILDIGATLLGWYTTYIQPLFDWVMGSLKTLWDDHLSYLWDNILSFISSVMEFVTALWNLISPFVDFIGNQFFGRISTVVKSIWGILMNVFGFISDAIGGIIKMFEGVLDFLTGLFTGNLEKAFLGICKVIQGFLSIVWGAIKLVINTVIDGLNLLWSAVYGVISGIVNGIGSIAGALGDMFGQDWHFSMPEEPPLIPKLARGGLVKAPTLALVGDNAGASTGDPEVVSPLSKLRGMIGNNDNSTADTQLLQQILSYLIKLYDMFYAHYQSGDICEISLDLDGDPVFKKIVQLNNVYKKRHGGKSAFA